MHTVPLSVRVCVLGSLLAMLSLHAQARERIQDDSGHYLTEAGGGAAEQANPGGTDGTGPAATQTGALRHFGLENGFGMVYRASDSVNLYGLRRRAYELPALSVFPRRIGRDNPGLDFWLKPRNVGDAEVGLKARIGKNLIASVSAFQNDSEDEFGSRLGPAGQYTSRSRRDGVELSLDSRWSNGVGAFLSYSLTRTSYTDASCGAVCANLGRATALARQSGAPDQILYGELSWRYPRFGLVTALEAKYVGRAYSDDINSDRTAAYFVANARLGLEQQAGRWRLQEFARIDNLTGRNYLGTAGGDSGFRLYDPNASRNYSIGISAGYSW
ncbi:MAG TPA: TonB-dependent receptor [Paucimonas sp.]|nr:TonB-dependent receptor [Paucimonas sp.]